MTAMDVDLTGQPRSEADKTLCERGETRSDTALVRTAAGTFGLVLQKVAGRRLTILLRFLEALIPHPKGDRTVRHGLLGYRQIKACGGKDSLEFLASLTEHSPILSALIAGEEEYCRHLYQDLHRQDREHTIVKRSDRHDGVLPEVAVDAIYGASSVVLSGSFEGAVSSRGWGYTPTPHFWEASRVELSAKRYSPPSQR